MELIEFSRKATQGSGEAKSTQVEAHKESLSLKSDQIVALLAVTVSGTAFQLDG